jgi:hypothetical protein
MHLFRARSLSVLALEVLGFTGRKSFRLRLNLISYDKVSALLARRFVASRTFAPLTQDTPDVEGVCFGVTPSALVLSHCHDLSGSVKPVISAFVALVEVNLNLNDDRSRGSCMTRMARLGSANLCHVPDSKIIYLSRCLPPQFEQKSSSLCHLSVATSKSY